MGDEKYSLETRVNSSHQRQKHALILAPKIEARHLQNIYQAILTFINLDYKDIHLIMKPLESVSCLIPAKGERDVIINDKKVTLYPNKVSSVTNAIENISRDLNKGDSITIYTTGHGTEGWYCDSRLSFSDRHLNPLDVIFDLHTHIKDKAEYIFIADQCYGYDFIQPLITHSKSIGISANKSGLSSFGWDFTSVFFPSLRKTKNLKKAFDCAYIQNAKKSSYPGRQEPQMIEVVDGKLRAYPDDFVTVIDHPVVKDDKSFTPWDYDVPREHVSLSNVKRLEALLNPGVKPRII
jgi:hypothetical protein